MLQIRGKNDQTVLKYGTLHTYRMDDSVSHILWLSPLYGIVEPPNPMVRSELSVHSFR